jgi:hypothetical protein
MANRLSATSASEKFPMARTPAGGPKVRFCLRRRARHAGAHRGAKQPADGAILAW